MLIAQWISTKWTKASRGADKNRIKRPRMADAYPLPPRDAEQAPILIHHISTIEWQDFRLTEAWGSPAELREAHHYSSMTLPIVAMPVAQGFAISVPAPSSRIQTHWPDLPDPLFVLKPGETALIDWNARLGWSLSGLVRKSYYEQDRVWLACGMPPSRDLFLTTAPRKHIDLRRHIY